MAQLAEPDEENVFHRLPKEFKRVVFDELFVSEKTDIVFRPDDAGQCDAVQLLQNIREWDATVYEEVKAYLCRDVFRFVFYSDRVPGLRALYQVIRRLPVDFRRGITRVFLPNYTLLGVDYYSDLRGVAQSVEPSPVQTQLWNADSMNAKVAMTHLITAFQSIRKLGIELDLSEFVFSRGKRRVSPSESAPITWLLKTLRTYPGIGEMEIRIFWARVPDRGLTFLGEVHPVRFSRHECENSVLDYLKQIIQAKRIEIVHPITAMSTKGPPDRESPC